MNSTVRKIILNVFCKTGRGGGINPTCSLKSAGGGHVEAYDKSKQYPPPANRDKLRAGAKVAITEGPYKGVVGTIYTNFGSAANALSRVKTKIGGQPVSIDLPQSHLQPKKGAKKEKEVDYDAQDKASAGRKQPYSQKTQHTLDKLNQAAEQAGQSLFSSHQSGLVRDRATKIRYRSLSELKKHDAAMDEYEYVFHPSTGKGLDTAAYGFKHANKGWQDKDGLIYSQHADTVYVTDPNA